MLLLQGNDNKQHHVQRNMNPTCLNVPTHQNVIDRQMGKQKNKQRMKKWTHVSACLSNRHKEMYTRNSHESLQWMYFTMHNLKRTSRPLHKSLTHKNAISGIQLCFNKFNNDHANSLSGTNITIRKYSLDSTFSNLSFEVKLYLPVEYSTDCWNPQLTYLLQNESVCDSLTAGQVLCMRKQHPPLMY